MRTLAALALLFTVSACDRQTPATVEAEPPNAEAPPAGEVRTAFAALPAETSAGQWFFRGDEGVLSAGFGLPQSEFQFTVACEQPSGKVTVMSDHELAPDQPTTLTLITERATVNLPASSFNEGIPSVTAELAGDTENAHAVAAGLGDPQPRFGVAVGEDVRVYPWSEDLARALQNCR